MKDVEQLEIHNFLVIVKKLNNYFEENFFRISKILSKRLNTYNMTQFYKFQR